LLLAVTVLLAAILFSTFRSTLDDDEYA